MPVNGIDDYYNSGTTLSSEDSGWVSYTNKPDTSSNIDLKATGLGGTVSAPIYSVGSGSKLETTDFGFTSAASSVVSNAFSSALEIIQGSSDNTALALKESTDLALQGKNTGDSSKLLTVLVVGAAVIVAVVWGIPKILASLRRN